MAIVITVLENVLEGIGMMGIRVGISGRGGGVVGGGVGGGSSGGCDFENRHEGSQSKLLLFLIMVVILI
jgi:hypothetical protein